MYMDKEMASEMYEVFSEVAKKEVVVRMFVKGSSIEEIAEATGFSNKQIKQQVIQVKAGEMLKSFDIASRMITKKFDLPLISVLTGLNKETVDELKREMIEKGEIEEGWSEEK